MKIYVADISSLLDEKIYERAFALASEFRQSKASALKNMPDKARCIGAGLLIDCAVSDYLGLGERNGSGVDINAVRLLATEGMDDNGGPFIKLGEASVAPFISISHSGEMAAAAISDERIGIDIQSRRKLSRAVIKKIMSPSEYGMLVRGGAAACGNMVEDDAALRIWTRKEAVSKLDGRGIFRMLPELTSDGWMEKLGVSVITKKLREDYYLSVAYYI